MTVTIKYGKDFSDSWIVFRGTPASVRADIIASFDLPADELAGVSLAGVVLNATKAAHALNAVGNKLGGTVIGRGKKAVDDSPPWKATDEAKADVWSQAEKPAEPEVNPLFAAIERAADTDALKRIWAENQDAFADAEIMAAWKARGKALSGAKK